MNTNHGDDGGPAFPVDWETFNRSNGKPAGMTLRDYFAAKAMQAICSALAQGIRPADISKLGADAYGIADAMLKEKKR